MVKLFWQGKWLPLHSLAASGEFFLLDKLLKHNVDINGVDKVCYCYVAMILIFIVLKNRTWNLKVATD